MLKIISSKNIGEVYALSRKMREKEKNTSSFLDCRIDEAEVLSENISIFGDTNAYLVKIEKKEEIENLTETALGILNQSAHLFVVAGNGTDFEKKINELLGAKSLKSIKLEKIVEKKTFDFPAELVSAIQKHDKKNSWHLLLRELESKEAEPVHGTLVFALKSLLVYLNDPKKNSPQSGVKDFSWNSAKRNAMAGKRERGEVVDKYFNLIVAYHKARSGELDLAKQLEKWVLEN